MGEFKEICWNLVNCIIAGGLVFLGALTNGAPSKESIIAAVIAASVVALSQFRNYWASQETEYCNVIFKFF